MLYDMISVLWIEVWNLVTNYDIIPSACNIRVIWPWDHIWLLWCHILVYWHHAWYTYMLPLRSCMISDTSLSLSEAILPGGPKSDSACSWLLCCCPILAPCRPLSLSNDAWPGLLLLQGFTFLSLLAPPGAPGGRLQGTSTLSISHRSAQGIKVPVDSEGWTLEPGLRQLSCGPTDWLLLLEGVLPSVLWKGWSGSAMHPLEARTCLATACTVCKRPVNHVECCHECMQLRVRNVITCKACKR